MHALRWKLFKLLSRVGWWVCPEPDKTAMKFIWSTGMDDVVQQIEGPSKKECG